MTTTNNQFVIGDRVCQGENGKRVWGNVVALPKFGDKTWVYVQWDDGSVSTAADPDNLTLAADAK